MGIEEGLGEEFKVVGAEKGEQQPWRYINKQNFKPEECIFYLLLVIHRRRYPPS